ncbi:Uncharacterised protein [Vibrio cholerae]|nr:Uncharacterised protein [Vibrio cholerae]CSI72706.1 Uncharacterised protein [Vibrio cholerae]
MLMRLSCRYQHSHSVYAVIPSSCLICSVWRGYRKKSASNMC